MDNWISECLDQWNRSEVKLNSPATTDIIQTTEVNLGFAFPDDFKDLYLICNGFEGLDWQQHMFSFWSLERIVEEAGETADKDFVGFCDFLLSSYSIGFRKSKPGIYKDYQSNPISQSFAAAVKMINDSDEEIY